MKKTIFAFCFLMLCFLGASTVKAQYVPTHPKYVTYITGDKSFADYFPTWEPGKELSEDENFFISRVKIKERFINRATQVIPDDANNNQRKFSMCVPMGISDTYWQTLPRYVMDGDNFGMWSYVDSQGGWSQNWIRTVGSYSDVCHKNGVANSGGVMFIDATAGAQSSGPQKIINMLITKNGDGSFKYLDKFMKFLRYYGIDGVTFNPEGQISNASTFQDFLAACHEKAAELGTQFHVYWYGANNNSGGLDLGSSLTTSKSNWFIKNGKDVADVYFLNYDWHYAVPTSTSTAERLRAGSTNNLYAGYDIQGNWLARGNWQTLKNSKMSCIFWGNHTTDMIYQNSTEMGSSDESVQKCYIQKQEQVFSGGNRNPSNTPAITGNNGVSQSSYAAMKRFHGVCSLVPARSTLQELPFITRFSLGNGKVFRSEGEETFKGKWYSLSSQDYLPTWRWWITGEVAKQEEETTDEPRATEPVLSAADVVQGQKYYIYTTARGGLCVKSETDNRIWGTGEVGASVDGGNPYQHFQFVEKDGKLYLFNVATQKYVTATQQGTLSTQPTDPVEFVGAANGTVRLRFSAAMNFNLGGSNQLTIDNWSTKDDGNSFKIMLAEEAGDQPNGLVDCGFTFDDSWYAGSCMTIKGATTQSTVRLFKTNFQVSASDAVNLVYKLKHGKESHAKLFWSFVGSEQTLHYADIPAGEKDAWKEFATTAGTIGMTGNVALIGLSFDETPEDYEMLVGEFGIVPNKSFAPVQPTITRSEFLERNFNGVNYKLIWDCGKSAASKADASIPTYNDDVDTWYFEVFSQAEGCEPVLDGVTTSWAHYVVGAYATPEISKYRFGVRAVAPDGKTMSPITWSEWLEKEATTIDGIALDRTVIKSGETFTISYKDPLHAAATKWQIVDPASGKDMVTPQNGGTKITCSIKELGTYDVLLTDASGKTTYRGFVQISTDATGALPVINDFTAEKTTLTLDAPSTAVKFDVARLGEGRVSHGLNMEDAYQFRIPKEALPASQKTYSVGLWIKPSVFAHSKYGTNLLNKRNTERSWPHNNWGAFWVIVWPQQMNGSQVALDDNVISYTMYKSAEGKNQAIAGTTNNNVHETPYYFCTTDRHLPCGETYALEPGVWSHVMITYDGNTKQQSIYFNGKRAVTTEMGFVEYDECPIYVGGSNVYHAGISGVIDDVQVWHKALSEDEVKTAMLGYEGKTVPSELKAYYTFEEYNADYTFANKGAGGNNLTGAYVALVGGAGEATSGTSEEFLEPNINVLGNPSLPGTLDVTTTASIFGPGLVGDVTTAGGTLTRDAHTPAGPQDVTMTLTNMWGTATLTKPGYINVTYPEGIEGQQTTDNGQQTPVFNLAGQRVKKATRGVFIQNGKAVVR